MKDYSEIKAMNARAGGADEAGVAKAQLKKDKSDGLTDMKRNKKEKKGSDKLSVPYEGEDYPYGLELRLDDDAMEKLGIDLPEVGGMVTITAKAKVRSAETRNDGSGERKNCCLQIQRLKVG